MPLVRKTVLPAAPPVTQDWQAQLAVLRTGSPDERFAAARALASEARAVPALEAVLAEPADSRLREAIFTSLARQNSVAGFAAVLRHLRSEDAALRSFALDAMRLMPDQIASHLPALLQDDDPDIRVLACELAREMPQGEAARLLAGRLGAEPQVNVCAAAIEVLAEIGGVAELPALAACAARFPDEYFLGFSIRAVSERIRARAGD